MTPTAEFGNRTDILTADIPAGGKMSARAVARLYAALLDEVDGVRLISPERLREVSAVAFSGIDQIMEFPTTWTLGYSVDRPGTDPQETPTVFGIGGVGGSYAYADTATRTTFALTKNRLTPSFDAAERVARIVTEAIGGGGYAPTRSEEVDSDLPIGLGKPARRALAAAGYVRLEQLTGVSEAEVMELHGMGPKALDHLRRALAAKGQRFVGS